MYTRCNIMDINHKTHHCKHKVLDNKGLTFLHLFVFLEDLASFFHQTTVTILTQLKNRCSRDTLADQLFEDGCTIHK